MSCTVVFEVRTFDFGITILFVCATYFLTPVTQFLIIYIVGLELLHSQEDLSVKSDKIG